MNIVEHLATKESDILAGCSVDISNSLLTHSCSYMLNGLGKSKVCPNWTNQQQFHCIEKSNANNYGL